MNSLERWQSNLARLRTKELEIVFKYLGETRFSKALELGAGNGFQSNILANICDNLTATDLNSDRLFSGNKHPRVEYKVLDAEFVGSSYSEQSFDFIYSSNLLEHIPKIDDCLTGCFNVLKDDGLMISIMPNPQWRLLSSILHYPIKIFRLLRYALARIGLMARDSGQSKNKLQGNNIKVIRGNQSYLNQLIPPPHGISKNSFSEFFAFRQRAWIRSFEKNGFLIVDILKGPISTGYGLGFTRLKNLMQSIGYTTEYIYVVKKITK